MHPTCFPTWRYPLLWTLLALSMAVGALFTLTPSSATFLTDATGLSLTHLEYSHLYILMIAGAIFSSYFSSAIGKGASSKAAVIVGCLLGSLGLAFFSSASFLLQQKIISYSLLLVAELLMGLSYGLLTSAATSLGFSSYVKNKTAVITALFVAGAVGGGISFFANFTQKPRSLSLYTAILCIALFALAILIAVIAPRQVEKKIEQENIGPYRKKKWAGLVAVALCYGFCETLLSVWGALFLTKEKGFSAADAAKALALFWLSIAFGRIVAYFISRRSDLEKLYPVFALLIGIGFSFLIFSKSSMALFAAFFLLGISCGPCLPLILSWGQKLFAKSHKKMAGHLVAGYMVGFSLAAFGAIALEKRKLITLSSLLTSGLWVACALAAFAFIVLKKDKT